MADEKTVGTRSLRYWIVGEKWAEGWFFVSLLVGLFWGVAGLAGAVASHHAFRAVGSKLPRPVAAAAALAVGVAATVAASLLLRGF